MSFLGAQCRHSNILNNSIVSKAIRHVTIPSEGLERGLSACQVPMWIRSFPMEIFPLQSRHLHYVLLLGQPLPEFPCTAWHISSQPAPSVPLILGQHVLLISPASRMYFGHLRSIVKIERYLPCPSSSVVCLTFLDAMNSVLYPLPYFQTVSSSTMTVISLL